MADGRITVLVENTAGGRGLLAEHGPSFWIELGGNARRLGIRPDLAGVGTVVEAPR